jgi:hypothetical protein
VAFDSMKNPAGELAARRGAGFLADAALALALAALLAQAVHYLVLGFDRPIYEQHGFRQTQTALSTYWILQGGPWLAYETPVLGAPWALPLEFPTFQLVAAGLVRFGIPLDQAGRLVSFGFFIATLLPLRAFLRELGHGRTTFLIIATLFVASPLYVFWGRTFMIESCAVFFGALWLAALARFANRSGTAAFLLALAAGCLAAVTKSTTFAGFGAIAGVIFLAKAVAALRSGELRSRLLALTMLGSLCAVPLAVGFAWVVYSDSVKLANPLAALLTSSHLVQWNYGTLDQRLSAAFWIDVVVKRMGLDIFGYALVLVPVVLGIGLAVRAFCPNILIGVGAFLLPLLIFTNLHFIHNYYANANAIFLIGAVGLAIAAIVAKGWRITGLLILACFLVGDARYLRNTYDFFIRLDTRPADRLQIAAMARQHVPRGEGLLVLGDGWSSGVPYYAERRSLVLFGFAPPALTESVVKEPQRHFGDVRLGGVVTCGDIVTYPPQTQAMIATVLAGRTALAESGSCRLYPPK